MNNVVLIGTLTRDPEMGDHEKAKVCDLRLVESSGRRESPLYIDVRAFGRQAQVCGEYLSKGRQVAIQGRLRCREIDLENECGKQMQYRIDAEGIDFLSVGSAGRG